MGVRGEEGDASGGRTSSEGHPAPGVWTARWMGKVSTPWVVFFVLELFSNNLEVFPGLLKLSTKAVLATMWKSL